MHVHFALHQGQELLAGDVAVGDVQFAALGTQAHEVGQRLTGALRAGLPEQFAQALVGLRGHHHPLDRQGRVGGDHLEERHADAQQLVAQGAFHVGHEQRVGQHLDALGLHSFGEQGLFVAEMAVYGQLRDAGLGRDAVHAHAAVALFDEQCLGCLEYRRALAQILGAPGTGSLGSGLGRRLSGSGRTHPANTRPSGSIFILYRLVH
ncbi:hypothetical protein D3C73_909030 [compost metagenome]